MPEDTKYIVNQSQLTAIGTAIREKLNEQTTYTVGEMPVKIGNISSGSAPLICTLQNDGQTLNHTAGEIIESIESGRNVWLQLTVQGQNICGIVTMYGSQDGTYMILFGNSSGFTFTAQSLDDYPVGDLPTNS